MQKNNEIRFAIITAARNEENYIEKTLQSVVNQCALPIKWIIVNDGSEDDTPAIVKRYTQSYKWIECIDMPSNRQRSFANKVHCFNMAYSKVKNVNFDVIGNLDADIEFDKDYFQFLMNKFLKAPRLGVAGTIFREDGYDSSSNSFEGQNHVAGGCQFFRRQCFEEIGGYTAHPAGGVDWIAVTTARMKGWETKSYKEKYFFHHRRLGTAERSKISAIFSYGIKDYYLGNHPIWELLRVIYRLKQKPILIGGIALGAGYLTGTLRSTERPVSSELISFHRKEELKKLRSILNSIIKLKRIDSFYIVSPK